MIHTVGAFEPPYERLDAVEHGAVLDDEDGERVGEHPHMVPVGAAEPARMGEDHSRVASPLGGAAPVQHGEVLDVLGDDGSAVGRRGPEQAGVGQPDQVGALLDGDGVVAAVAQSGRDGGGVHLVEEEPHSASSLRSFSQAADSRSAMSSLRLISSSISAVNSA